MGGLSRHYHKEVIEMKRGKKYVEAAKSDRQRNVYDVAVMQYHL